MCIVIDLNVVCLVCLQPSKDLHPIFTSDDDDPDLQIAQKITILSELTTDQNNQSMPKKICGTCLQDLKAAWRFRKNCKAAITIIQTIVKLDNADPQNAAPKELKEQDTKVPNGLQILLTCISTADGNNEDGDSAKSNMSEINEETTYSAKFMVNTDKTGSTIYEERKLNNCTENNETDEFEAVRAVGENEQHEYLETDENNLVEYCLSDEDIPDELNNTEEKEERMKMVEPDKEKPNLSKYVEQNKALPRGRPRKQNFVQKIVKNHNIIQTQSEEAIVIDSANSSEEANQINIRKVKTRRRKSPVDGKTPKICEICGNSYRFKHALVSHMRRHYNDKPFPCEFCDKAFVSNVELRRHMRVHTGQKPYACQYCERRFSDFGSRIKHERTHTGERPYLCVTCGKSFAYAHVLSVHVRIHTGEKKFRCDYCSKGFTKKRYLLSHINQHHISFEIIADDILERNQSHPKSTLEEEDCFTTEFVNEDQIDETEEYLEGNEGDSKTIKKILLRDHKMEDGDEEDLDEITVKSERFTEV